MTCKFTIGSEEAPVQRAKKTSGSELRRKSSDSRMIFSSLYLFLMALERIFSNHCKEIINQVNIIHHIKLLIICQDRAHKIHGLCGMCGS
jgi:hypothetical protein